MSHTGGHGGQNSQHEAADSAMNSTGMNTRENMDAGGEGDALANRQDGLRESATDTIDQPGNLVTDTDDENRRGQMPSMKVLPSTPPPPQPPSKKERRYQDPTPKTPAMSRQPSRRTSEDEYNEKDSVYTRDSSDRVADDRPANDTDAESASEIQSIMEQFADEAVAPTRDEIMSPRQELPGPLLGTGGHFPPRRSSLEPLRSREKDSQAPAPGTPASDQMPSSPPAVPPKSEAGPLKSPPMYTLKTGSSTSLPTQPPPPEPEPDLPFDFHRFLEQLRHKSADPVARFLRSFLTEFGKKQWMVHEQVKIINDFLAFIANKMALCDVWRDVSDTEFDNAKEGMEKLVMNRLYAQTFSPAIPPPVQPARSRSRGRRKEADKELGPGRRGQHQEDVERDEILAQKIRIYSWVREEHLDIAPVGPNGERFLRLAQQELLKIKGYRAPRDKVICVLNCCKVIFGLLKNSKSSDLSADAFVPLLIYVVLQANPDNLVSNLQYILRFRNQDKLGGEAGYYLSSLSAAIQFIENLDRTSLTVTDEEFERNVELAVSEIAAQNREADALSPLSPRASNVSEKSSLAEPAWIPRNSVDVSSSRPGMNERDRGTTTPTSPTTPPTTTTLPNQSPERGSEDSVAVAGLLRTIQRPLSTIGRIFADQDTPPQERRTSAPSPTPRPAARLSPSVFQPPSGNDTRSQDVLGVQPTTTTLSYDAQEAAARQASAEAAEARRIQRAEHRNVVDALSGMFPNLDREVIDDVVHQKQGRVGLAVDACLALTAGS